MTRHSALNRLYRFHQLLKTFAEEDRLRAQDVFNKMEAVLFLTTVNRIFCSVAILVVVTLPFVTLRHSDQMTRLVVGCGVIAVTAFVFELWYQAKKNRLVAEIERYRADHPLNYRLIVRARSS